MTTQNRKLGSGFGVVDIKFLISHPTEDEFKQFGPNEYLLIQTKENIELFYIDTDNNKQDIAIDTINGLEKALIELPNVSFDELEEKDKIPVLGAIQKYHLNTRGGNEFLIFKDEKYQGLMNHFPKEKMPLVHEWIQNAETHQQNITAILDDHTLALVIPDILRDLDVTFLANILPKIVANLSEDIKESFSNEEVIKKLDKRFLNSIKKSKSNLVPNTLDAKSMNLFLSKDNIERISPEIMAYLIPAILDLMKMKDLTKASVAIAKQLTPKNFRALADENYFQFNVEMSDDDPVTLRNNQRTIAFAASNSTSKAKFRGKEWFFDHTHMHLEGQHQGNAQEREYKVYESRQELEAVKNGSKRDPNLDVVGEIHSVYKRTAKHGTKYTAVGFLLTIGNQNDDFEKILKQVESLGQITEEKKLDILINYQKMFMPTLKKAQANNSIFLHSWASLKSEALAFKAGLRFNVVPETIAISQKQYDRFKELFGEMAVLTEKEVLEPIDRNADYHRPKI